MHRRESGDRIELRDAGPPLELACWTILVAAALLRWVNGPAVSSEQFAVQATIVCIGVAGAGVLRVYNWRTHR